MGRPFNPCACGCGQLTSRTYRRGHRPIKSYPAVKHGDGTQRVHILRAEKALGHKLPKGAVVHHADGSTAANAPLVICPNAGYHMLLHARMRVQAAGGDPNTQRICGTCKQLCAVPDMVSHHSQPANICKACLRAKAKVRHPSSPKFVELLIGGKPEALTMMQWYARFGIDRSAVQRRIKRGWTLHDALTVSTTTRHRKPPEQAGVIARDGDTL